MLRFAMEQNVKRFRQLLDDEQDSKSRSALETLLAEEEAKLRSFDSENPPAGNGAS